MMYLINKNTKNIQIVCKDTHFFAIEQMKSAILLKKFGYMEKKHYFCIEFLSIAI